MLEERKNLLDGMAVRGDSHYSAQQKERISGIRKQINRLREFLLNGGNDSSGAEPENLTGQRH